MIILNDINNKHEEGKSMNKLTIKCKGETRVILDRPDERLADYLWGQDIEVTNIFNNKCDEQNVITFFGFEMVDGLMKKILDKRKKDNIYNFLEGYNLENIDIISEECEDSEYMDYCEKYKELETV